MALVFDQVRLHGLRSFRNATEINLRPITLLYGQNSAGKSTVIKTLLLLQQTFASTTQKTAGHFIFSGESVDLGSFTSAVSDHSSNNRITVGIQIPSGPATMPVDRFGFGLDEVAITWTVGPEISDLRVLIETRGHRLQFEPRRARGHSTPSRGPRNNEFYLALTRDSIDDFVHLLSPQEHLFDSADRLLSDLKSNIGLQPAFKINLVPRSAVGVFRNSELTLYGRSEFDDHDVLPETETLARRWDDFSRKLMVRLRTRLEKLSYIGPLRQQPQRFERYSPSSDATVGQHGQSMLSLLFANNQYTKNVNIFLKQMEMPYQLKVAEVKAQETLGSLIYMTLIDDKGLELAPTDVGVGYSQVLPLITQSVASQGSMLCIEQPELHLHPAMQSRLADVFIESARAGSNVQYIIETHSENLVLRMMKRIRQGSLDPSDLQVIYIDQDESGTSSVVELPLDKHGDFQRAWPHGFFDERLHEIDFD